MEKEIKKMKEEIAKLKTRVFDLEIEIKNILKNYSKPITIQSLSIREEIDINKIAEELHKLSSITKREFKTDHYEVPKTTAG